MIAGNPKAGRVITTAALALLMVILISTGFVAMRKKTAPQKEPPLHPSTITIGRR